MKTTVGTGIAAAALTVAAMAVPAGAQSTTPSATDKVTINGWA